MWGKNPVASHGTNTTHQSNNGSKEERSEDMAKAVLQALETCRTNYQFIASQAEHLQRLRSECVTSALITRQEIRALEVKLVRLFGQQLAIKRRLPVCVALPTELHSFPSLTQWLSVVGLSADAVQSVCSNITTLEALLCVGESGVAALLGATSHCQANKLYRATQNLRRYTGTLLGGSESTGGGGDGPPYYWDSWEQQRSSCPSSPRHHRPSPHLQHREARSSVSSSDGDTSSEMGGGSFSATPTTAPPPPSSCSGGAVNNHRSSDESSTPSSPPALPTTPSFTLHLPPPPLPSSSTPIHDHLRYTPPTTPPTIKTPKSSSKVSTPPPNKKYLLTTNHAAPSGGTLGRSTSHESQLAAARRAEAAAAASSAEGSNTNNSVTTGLLHYSSGAAAAGGGCYAVVSNANDHHHQANCSTIDGRHVRHHSDSSSNEVSSTYAGRTPPTSTSIASPTRHYHHHHHHTTTTLPYHHYHPLATNEEDSYNKNSVPRSPRTPPLPGNMGSMVHNVQHRFVKFINIKPATCGYCHQKFPILGGLRCKECNFKCHRECESKLPPSCGLPNEYLKIFTESLNNSLQGVNSSSHHTIRGGQHHGSPYQVGGGGGPDSSSNTSSCNSSTPSSPALLFQPPSSPALSKHHHHHLRPSHHNHQHTQQLETFHYPEVTRSRPTDNNSWGNLRGAGGIHSLTSTSSSTLSATRSDVLDSAALSTNSGSGSTDDSDRTVAERVDSQDSTISDGLVDSTGGGGADSSGGGGGGGYGALPASSMMAGEGCSRQNSVSQGLREWDIPYDELDKGKIIGRGRFATVYSGNWHGQVAIKELHMEYGNDQNTLEAFKSEVSMFRKTRHQNLALFMGACMKLPRLAIVTSLCKGSTLYKHIHVLRDKFTMSNTISIAQQVAQGMGYLHARGIVHKDLKTKNIFLENGSKVVITDFGLVNVTRLCQNNRGGSWLSIPTGWLCYLSPELMRELHASYHQPHPLPHTTTTDVYAYGTVWFELLCGEWPHKGLPAEAIIWQVGRGIKPSLAHLQASRDVKDILMDCWSYRADDRPDFAVLQDQLKRLPKKRLARSPSHPIHLSRSAECVF